MSMRCDCGCEAIYLFAHCRQCIVANRPSANMKAILFPGEGVDGGAGIEMYCATCGSPVYTSFDGYHFDSLDEAEGKLVQ